MKPLLWRIACLSLVNCLFIALLLTACGETPVAEMTSAAFQIDKETPPKVTATLNLNTATKQVATTFTPVLPMISPSPSATPLPPATPPPRTPTSSPLDGWLVFESAQENTNGDGVINGSDNIHIYSLNLNTNELVQLTSGDYRDWQPAWSPDRRGIVFVSNRSGNSNLYVMNADGSNIRQLTETPEGETSPIWTSDGQHIIYSLVGETLAYGLPENHLYIISASGENNRQLIDLPGSIVDPDLSPDGRFLAYTQNEPLVFEEEIRTATVVYLYDMQSAQNFRITSSVFESNKGQFQSPKWLPRQGWYLSMIQTPGDMNPSGMKVFELSWNEETPLLEQVLEFDEGPGHYTWGPNGEWLISANNRTVFTEDGEAAMTTDLSVVPIMIPAPQAQVQSDPAMQRSEHVLPQEGSWLTNDIFYEGHLDWSP